MSSAPVVDFSLSTVGPAVAWADEIAKAKEAESSVEPSWEAFPWQVPALVDESPVVLLTGSVGGGKSHLWREMVHNYMLDNPGAFGLVARQTRESMTAGAMLAVGANGAAAKPKRRAARCGTDNGSMVAYVGMKDATQRTQASARWA